MSDSEGTEASGEQGAAPGGGEPDAEELSPEQEQMLRQMEEEMRRVRVQDLVAQSVVSILNLSYRRIAKEDERDLEQGRVGIEAVRALLDLVEPGPREQLREALSQVQVLYAREAGGGGSEAEGAPEEKPEGGGAEQPKVQRPAGLWTPPGTS